LAIADDFAPPIYCAIPSFSSQVQVDVVHVEKPNVVYVRPTICEDLTNQLLDDMYEFYENGGKRKFIVTYISDNKSVVRFHSVI
jgi:hypothetical protein